jgi:undecaprenyl-diphosphatase
MAGLLLVGSVPAAVAGLTLESTFERLFSEPPTVALFLAVTAAMLFVAERLYARRPPARARDISRVGWKDAVTMGVFQAVAIAPGISRSGATISAGLTRGLTRDASARFSFLLGLPAILGAGLLKMGDLTEGVDAATVAGATAVSAVTGFAAIALLLRYLRVRDTRPFAWYCLLFGAVSLGYWLQVS